VLTASKGQSGHALAILQLVASLSSSSSSSAAPGTAASIDAAIRQAAAVHFKNLVSKGWDVNQAQQQQQAQQQHDREGQNDADADDDDDDGIAILLPENERHMIKSHLVQLMCETPPQIQVQLSTAIALIAATDYYQNWPDLLPSLVQQFQSPDIHVTIGVLKTANSIFKAFRHVARSDALYETIIYTLERSQAQLLALLQHLGEQVFQSLQVASAASGSDNKNNNALLVVEQVKLRLEALRLCNRIFYSLNYQDLPAYFEDHMGEVMTEFAKYLQQTPALTALSALVDNPHEETEPSPLDQLQAAIINNLALYADKDEESFCENDYLSQFTSLVWNNLLVVVTPQAKHDLLATTSIKFLSSLVSKPMHTNLFESSPDTLPQIVAKIVIPNLYLSIADKERFFDDGDYAQEYMVTEVEGSDSESRRKCSQDLLRSMCRQYEAKTTSICSHHVGSMLQAYAVAPNEKWADKDAAVCIHSIHMMGVCVGAAVVFFVIFSHRRCFAELYYYYYYRFI
jgi:exportin-2 (importin alpha re-exporter)